MFQKQPKLYLVLAAKLGSLTVIQVVLVLKVEEVMESSCTLLLCGRATVPEESLGEAIGESEAHLHQRGPSSLGSASAVGCPPRTATAVEQSQLEGKLCVLQREELEK